MKLLVVLLGLVPGVLLAQPNIKFEDKTKRFDRVKAGELLSFDFLYENAGDAPLIISEIKVTCPCTKFTYSKSPLPPGQKDTIHVTFDTNKKIGYQDRTLEIYSNSKRSPDKISFKGMVDYEPEKD